MQKNNRLVYLAAATSLALAVGAAQAALTLNQTIAVEGSLVGSPVPQHWRLLGASVVQYDDGIFIRVTAEGNCRNEWREECHVTPDGRYVCHRVPEWRCDQAFTHFRLPDSIRVEGKNVLYAGAAGTLQIGKVKSFLFWKWIELAEGADLQATYDRARLVLDPSRLSAPESFDREARFASLHGAESELGFLVRFRGMTNERARETLRAAGYAGEFAAINTWTRGDVESDRLGIRVTPGEGAAVLSRLQQNPLVLGIEPVEAN